MQVRHILVSVLVFTNVSVSITGQQTSNAQLSPVYRKWLNEDVLWIITPEERKAFRHLATDDQRDKYIADFWDRRNPKPGSKENSFKQEHYRRLAFSNEHFAAGVPGSRTDRGRVYVVYGPPDSIKATPKPTSDQVDLHEVWFYKHLDGIGDDISLEFVDECRCGAYELRRSDQNVLFR